MTGTALLLARHGQTADNASGLILGRRDPPLSQLGERQAAGLAVRARAGGVVAIWCSPLLRARQTAAIAGQAIGVSPAVLQDLIESDRGEEKQRGGVPPGVTRMRSSSTCSVFQAYDPDTGSAQNVLPEPDGTFMMPNVFVRSARAAGFIEV